MRDPKDLEIRGLRLQMTELQKKVKFYKSIINLPKKLEKQNEKIFNLFETVNDKLAQFLSFYEGILQEISDLIKQNI